LLTLTLERRRSPPGAEHGRVTLPLVRLEARASDAHLAYVTALGIEKWWRPPPRRRAMALPAHVSARPVRTRQHALQPPGLAPGCPQYAWALTFSVTLPSPQTGAVEAGRPWQRQQSVLKEGAPT